MSLSHATHDLCYAQICARKAAECYDFSLSEEPSPLDSSRPEASERSTPLTWTKLNGSAEVSVTEKVDIHEFGVCFKELKNLPLVEAAACF